MPFLDSDGVARLLQPRVVVRTEPLGGDWAPVVRAVLDDGSTVVVKERRRHDGGWGFDPGNLRSERAALEALSLVEEGGAIGPSFVAGDDEAGILVMTDVGRGPTVQDHLLDPDGGATATSALIEHGRALARLHAATTSRELHRTFVTRRRAFDGDYDEMTERTRYAIHDLPTLWDEVAVHATALGFTPPSGTEDDAARLWRELAFPGPFLALTSLDANPQNGVVRDDGTVRLVDFEGAGLRHLGLDAAFLRFPFPNYGHWSVLPEDVRAAMEDAYRETLVAGGLVAASDDGAYARAVAVGCAATVVLRVHRLSKIADDRDEQEAVRRRTQMVSAIEVVAGACERAGMFSRLSAWFAGLGEEMRSRWPEAAIRPREFPALPLSTEGASTA